MRKIRWVEKIKVGPYAARIEAVYNPPQSTTATITGVIRTEGLRGDALARFTLTQSKHRIRVNGDTARFKLRHPADNIAADVALGGIVNRLRDELQRFFLRLSEPETEE